MLNVTQLRVGVYFLYNSHPHKVLQYSHTHMGRGGGTIKVKIQNLSSGSIITETFKGNDRVEDITIAKQQFQFLYQDGSDLVFMHPQTFEQLTILQSTVGDKVYFLEESVPVWLLVWEDVEPVQVLDIELPAKVEAVVSQTEPGERGDSATTSFKPATLTNGFQTKVPPFVNEGDRVVISTVDGSYVSRA